MIENLKESIIKGETHYYLLYCRCPECNSRGYQVDHSIWKHEGCGGTLYIGDNACLFCETCGKEIHISNVAFKCPCCRHTKEEIVEFEPKEQHFFDILSSLHIGLVKNAGIHFLTKFCKNLEKD